MNQPAGKNRFGEPITNMTINLDAPAPVITIKEKYEGMDWRDLRRKLPGTVEDDIVSKKNDKGEYSPYVNEATGNKVIVTKKSVDHFKTDHTSNAAATKNRQNTLHYEMIEAIPDIIRKGIWVEYHVDKHGKGNRISLIFALVEMNDNKYAVKITVKAQKHGFSVEDGEYTQFRAYDISNEKEPMLGSTSGHSSSSEQGPDRPVPSIGSNISIRDFLQNVNDNLGKPYITSDGTPNYGIYFGDNKTGAIHLFDAADQSSFIHESAHMFLSGMEMLAREPNAPAGIVADLQAVKNWAGYKPGQMTGYKGTALEEEFQKYAEAIREAKKTGDDVAIKSAEVHWMHERFARGFERYLADGEAPTPSLKHVFEQFMDWMVGIYLNLKNLGKKPPKEIQEVMARMITPGATAKYSVRKKTEQMTWSKEDLKGEIKEAFPNAKEIKDEGDRMTFTMPNGSRIVVDLKNEILLTDEELAQAKKDHHIDDNGNVIVEGYAEVRGKGAYMALAQGSRKNTGFHEAYHLAEGAVLTDREKAAIKKAIPDAEKRADKYAAWVEARKHGRGTAWGKLFQKIKDFAAKIKSIFTRAETVHDVFRQIESGKVWERGVNKQKAEQFSQPLYKLKHIVGSFKDKEKLNKFVNTVLTHGQKSLVMHLGIVNADEAKAIKKFTGYDVNGYEHVWRGNDVQHVQKRHGVNTETANNQIGLSPDEMVDALKVISAPDKIERGSINKDGPSIRYIKAENGGQLTIVEVVKNKRKTLDIKTMWKKRAEKLHGNYALQDTSETALNATSSTTENVAHNADNVNGEKHYSIRKPKDAADEAQEKAEQVAEDTAVTMKDILAAARKILPIYTRSKIYYNSRAAYRYDNHGRAGFVPSNYTIGDIGASIALHLDHVAQLKRANVELTNDVLDELEIEQRAAKKYKQEAPKAMTPAEARREGVKEFGRIYFQDPARAKEKYPKYYDIFEKTLDGMPEEKAAVEKILELEAQRVSQNPLLLATAGISLADDRKKPPTVKERLNTAWARFYRTMVDETDPLRQITKCIEMELGKKLADEKDPHKRAVMCNSMAEGRASMLLFADNKAANIAYLNKIYKGAIRNKVVFEDVLNTLREVRTEDIKKAAAKDVETYFGMYLVAQRTEEIVKTHKDYTRPEGYSHENCLRIIAEAPEAITPGFTLTALRAVLEWRYNYSEWTGRKLVPERLSKLPPEQQYTTATSELAKSGL